MGGPRLTDEEKRERYLAAAAKRKPRAYREESERRVVSEKVEQLAIKLRRTQAQQEGETRPLVPWEQSAHRDEWIEEARIRLEAAEHALAAG